MLKRMLFRYQGHVSAALVLGGVDSSGAHLYQVRQALEVYATDCGVESVVGGLGVGSIVV